MMARAGDSRSSHHPLGLGAVAAQVRSVCQLRHDGGLDVGETELGEVEVGGDGGVVDAEEGEDQSDEDACAFCRGRGVSGWVCWGWTRLSVGRWS